MSEAVGRVEPGSWQPRPPVDALPRGSILVMLLLTGLTKGIYPVMWLALRASAINELPVTAKVNVPLALVAMLLTAVDTILFFFTKDMELPLHLELASFALTLTCFMMACVTAFQVKNALVEYYDLRNGPIRINRFLLVVFQGIYLQYKFNQAAKLVKAIR